MNDHAALIRSLDARYYTDPQVFEIERTGLLARTWQFGCHLSELAGIGAYVSFEIAGESLFAIRGRDDQIRVFYNVCQHRAHQLVSGSGVTRVVVCPYHAWTYELTGQLRSGPNLKAVEGFRQIDRLPDRGPVRGLPGVPVCQSRPACRADGGLVPRRACGA